MIVSQAADSPAITLLWGKEGLLALDVPERWPAAEVVLPDLSAPLVDYRAALVSALDSPEGGRRLEEGIGPGTTVAIVVDDPSRWTPVREALPVLLERIHAAGVHREDVSICVGVGRHLAVDDQHMRKHVGEAIASSYRCYSPPVDDLSQYVELGRTPGGIPVRVFRPVAEAGLRVLVGSVLPHLQAGFGGGYKLIFPGTCHRSTLGALHRQGLGGDAGRLLGGEAEGNPMRCAIREAAGLLRRRGRGPCFSVSHLLGDPGQVLFVAAGSVDVVQDLLAAEARHRFEAPAGVPADVLVAGNDPWPGDPMQSFKVLLNHRAASRRDGVLVGFFWTDPAEIDRSFPLPALRAIAMSGSFGGWLARRSLSLADRIVSATQSPSAFMVRWARELVVDRTVHVYAPPLRERLGPHLGPIRLHAEQSTLWNAVALALGENKSPRVRIFPKGGLTYCPQP
jgi:hypothetical protein